MKIEYLNGDLFALAKEHNIRYIAHGVNCQGVMGSGFAKQIRDKFPEVYEYYKVTCKKPTLKESLLGSIQPIMVSNNVVINCFTQLEFGSDKQFCSYDAIAECMDAIDTTLDTTLSVRKVIMPKIGAGLGGGNWEIIERIIEEKSPHFQPVVAVLG